MLISSNEGSSGGCKAKLVSPEWPSDSSNNLSFQLCLEWKMMHMETLIDGTIIKSIENNYFCLSQN